MLNNAINPINFVAIISIRKRFTAFSLGVYGACVHMLLLNFTKALALETSDGIAVRFSAELLIERVFNFLGQKFCAAVAKQKLRSATVLRSKSPRKIPVALGKALWMSRTLCLRLSLRVVAGGHIIDRYHCRTMGIIKSVKTPEPFPVIVAIVESFADKNRAAQSVADHLEFTR